MDIEVFTLCDAAADYQGRLNILGIFDSIFASNLPAIHPHCAVALRLRFHRNEEGKHSLSLRIIGEEEEIVLPEFRGEFKVQIPEDVPIGTINLVANLNRLKLNKFGEYSINLSIDSHELGSLPFRVKRSE